MASKRRVRETRNKNKEDRNVSKFVVSSAMGLNAYGIYANDSIFKPRWTVRTFLRYLSRRNRILKEEKLLEIEKRNNFSSLRLKIDRGLESRKHRSIVFSNPNTMNPSPSITRSIFLHLARERRKPVYRKITQLSRPPLRLSANKIQRIQPTISRRGTSSVCRAYMCIGCRSRKTRI